MIVMSEALKKHMEGFETRESTCEFFGISYPTLMSYLNGHSVSSAFIEQVKQKLNWDFEKAFDIKEEK